MTRLGTGSSGPQAAKRRPRSAKNWASRVEAYFTLDG